MFFISSTNNYSSIYCNFFQKKYAIGFYFFLFL